MNRQEFVNATRRWVRDVVVNLNLCPFARRELVAERIRYTVSEATDETQLLVDLQSELQMLENDPGLETTLFIHPFALQDFHAHNDFLDLVDYLLAEESYEGIYQVVSFHPDYLFDKTLDDDAANYTNRSPFPMLHILRESSVELALSQYDDATKISAKNIALLQSLGNSVLKKRLAACYKESNDEANNSDDPDTQY